MYIGVYKSLCGIGVKINMKYKIYFEYLSFLLICLYFYVILYVVICILNFVFFIMKKKNIGCVREVVVILYYLYVQFRDSVQFEYFLFIVG